MKRLITLGMVSLIALSLSGCMGIQAGASAAGNYVCNNQESIRYNALFTIQNAQLIEDPTVRAIMVGMANTQLTALNACPVRPAPGAIQ